MEPMNLFEPAFTKRWPRRFLWDTADWINGLAFRDIAFSADGDPVIKIGELKGGVSSNTKRTRQNFDSQYRVNPGDILYSWSGSPETSLDVFTWSGPPGWLNQHIFKVRAAAGVDKRFHLQLLRYLRPNLVAIATNKQTTGLGHVTQQDMRRITVGIPGLHEQRAIARILGVLDDKIELNRRTSETLEAIARAIFQSWFVESPCGNKRLVEDLIAERILVIGDGYRAKNDELGAEGLPFARAGDVVGGEVNDTADHLLPGRVPMAGDKVSKPGDVVERERGFCGRARRAL